MFAPTNEAFASAQDVIDTLSPEQLKYVLTYHRCRGSILSSRWNSCAHILEWRRCGVDSRPNSARLS